MSIRFLIDAQLSRSFGRKLQAKGYDCTHVITAKLAAASDIAIWAHAKREGRVLISKDRDFALMSRSDPTGPQVVWLRLGNATDRLLWDFVEPMLPQIDAALRGGDRLIEIA